MKKHQSKKTSLYIGIAVVLIVVVGLIWKSQTTKGYVTFTFDDAYVDSWYNHLDLFDKYNVKATFFIVRPHLLTDEQKTMLQEIRNRGHEIGCHTLEHKNALDYINNDSLNIYVETQIKPAMAKLKELGYNTETFAYPFGASNAQTDSVMNKHFKLIRKATYNKNQTTLDSINEIYYTRRNNTNLDAMGIDRIYNINLDNLERGLIRAYQNNEALLLHAHKITNEDGTYVISEEYLENAFKLAKKHKVKAITYKELLDL